MAIQLSATGIINDYPFYSNSNTVAASFTTTAYTNYMSVGPMTINTGVTVTVSDNSVWVIL